MKIYLASKYERHELNRSIKYALEETGDDFKVLLPENLNLEEKTEAERREVKKKCCGLIRESDVLLAVEPFGRDVAYEIGYAQALKDSGKMINIVRIGSVPRGGAMVDPSISFDCPNAVIGEEIGIEVSKLLDYLKKIEC